MLFIEPRFFVFFLVVFSVHWMLRGNTERKIWLLAASHFFYACFFIGPPVEFVQHFSAGNWAQLPKGWWFPVFLWGSTLLDYVVGLKIVGAQSPRVRKAWLALSVGAGLAVLGFFKYFNFFLVSASDFLDWFGLHTSVSTLQLILPYGISFYTFQSMSYSIDVYRGRLEPVRKFVDLAFFVSFFPQLVAGPIVRAVTFLPQIGEKRIWERVEVRAAVALFLIGFIKKALISEFVATYADAFFSSPTKYNHPGAIIGVLCYAVQIYCDFSGYTDMAIASSRLLGYELTPNFAFPYFSANITEFWRRWHISLSTWLRDYLYIPLGGNRGSKLFTYRNLMLTMLLGGLWHGASWTFVIWGGMHGVALIVHREWQTLTRNAGAVFHAVMRWVGPILTFYWVCIAWIFFRAAPNYNEETGRMKATALKMAGRALDAFTTFGGHGSREFDLRIFAFLGGLAVISYLSYRGVCARLWRMLPGWAASALLGAGVAFALLFVPVKYKAFIYFQF